jgi:hypothetical protein
MQAQSRRFLRAGSALALVLVVLPLLAACTPGGQFDPTELFNSDVFDSKKKLSGQRVPVFPDGVPGTTTGVPPDLVKGYQPPPDPSDADASQTPPPPAGATEAPPAKTASAEPAPTAEAKPKPKLRPKPKVASAPAGQTQNSVWNRAQPGPAKSGPTRINVGGSAAPAQSGGQDQNAAAPTNWPAPAPPPPASNAAQANWPAPQSSNAAQTTWPAPASNSPAQRIQEDWPSSSSNASAPKTAQ